MPNAKLEKLQSIIGYRFNDIELLRLSLSHSSFANEERMSHLEIREIYSNERLEFLGDAVLELVTSHYIYGNNADMQEGEMSKYRASIVCEPTLAACARRFSFQEYIYLGRGEEGTGGRERDSIISDALEALIGAMYLDGGLDVAKDFINRFILDDIENIRLFYDSKSRLQECLQSLGTQVEYTEISEEGPQHDKTFTVEARCDGFFKVTAQGHTKKAAQQECAYRALLILREKGLFPVVKRK